ncbi:MAG: hypothetical protein A2X62_13095 [Stygiobacter sp. GWC2_38_9]|nr:MAG: hypothetical protein A2X62_13095 [Stygiobacter sp. GWC2_38_9]
MKNYFYALLFVLIISSTISTQAQSKKFGLGVIFGEPTGLSAKLWLSNTNALAFGLGWSVQGYRFNGFDSDSDRVTRTHIHVDYLWRSFNAISSSREFPLFYGIGGKINTGPEYSGTFGVRGVIGIAWLPRSTPLDIFIEVVPTLLLVNSTGLGIDAGIGARFFF